MSGQKHFHPIPFLCKIFKNIRTLNNTRDRERFLLYDSYGEADFKGRLIIYATRQNIQKLMRCKTWFLNGTFDISPNMFTQVFAILGSVNQTVNCENQEIGLSFVYALMTGKEEVAYTKVLQIILSEAERLK